MLDYIVVGSGIGSFCISKRLADEHKSFIVISDFKKCNLCCRWNYKSNYLKKI